MKNITKLILSLIITLSVLQYVSAQTYDLKLNLKKGQKYNQSMTMNMDMAESLMGQDIKIATKSNFVFAQEVKSIDKDGNYTIESAYSRLAMDVDAMGTKISYDSDKKGGGDKGSEELSKTFSGMIGKKYTVIMTPKGKVIKMEGLKEIIAELSKNASPTTAQLLAGTFDEKKMAANYSSSYDIFPEGSVSKGDTWKRKTSVESVFPMDIESVYTLKDIKNGIATIGMAAEIQMKKDDAEMQGMQVKVDLKGSYTGDYHMDVLSGLGVSASLSMPIKGTMEVMSTIVPLEVTSTIESSTTQVR